MVMPTKPKVRVKTKAVKEAQIIVVEIHEKVFITQPLLGKVPSFKFLDFNLQDETHFLEL